MATSVSRRRWLSWTAQLLAAALVFGCVYYGVRAYLVLEDLDPFADEGISRDLRPLAITFTTPRGIIRWRIPKAYITDRTNWPGGEQAFIEMSAALYLRAPDMPPFAVAGDPRGDWPRPDDEIHISLVPTGHFAVDEIWRNDKLPIYKPSGSRGELTIYHDTRTNEPDPYDHIFAPAAQGAHDLYFDCAAYAENKFVKCTGSANFSEDIALDYMFDAKYLARWREIDARVRRLVASFLQSGGGPRAVTDAGP